MQYNISDGITSDGIVLDGSDAMIVLEGGIANNTTVKAGRDRWRGLFVSSGGTANKTTVNSGGWILVSSGGTANSTMVNSGGMMAVFSGGTANDTIVYSGGSLDFYPSATINRATVNFGGKMRLNELDAVEIKENGGYVETVYYYDDDEKKRVTFVSNTFSGIELINNSASVHSGTTANNTIVNSSGVLIIWDGGVANGTTVKSGGQLFVWSGGTANDTFIIKKESIYDFGGVVESGGTVNRTTLDDGMLCISSGGTANNTIINFGGYMYGYEANNTIINSGGSMYFYEANNTIVNSGGELEVSCMASNTYINSGGSLWFATGASATIAFNPWQGSIDPDVKQYISYLERDANVYYGGSLGFLSKADVMDSMNIMSGYSAIVYSGGVVRDTKIYAAGTVEVLSGGKLTGKMNFLGGAIVSVEKGAILDFDLTQTAAGGKAILSDWSLIQGTPDCVLTVGASQASGIYKLADNADEFDGTLSVRNTAGESFGPLAVGGTMAVGKATYTLTLDDESLVLTITGGAKPDTKAPTVSSIRASTTKQTDQAVTVTAVFADDVALESSLYRLGENGAWTDYENGVTVTENTTIFFKAVDVAGNESKIVSYKVSNIKSSGADVLSGMPDGSRNNWLYEKKIGVNPDSGGFVATEVSASTEEIRLDKDGDVDFGDWLNYVGYDDPADFARISLENDAKLSFLANATGAAKLVIYRLTEGTGKKTGTYTMKALQTTTLKKPRGATEYTAETKGLLLVAGDYYIAMKSTGTKTGSIAYYNVNLNEKSAFFTNGDDGRNNWLYEKKTGPNPDRDDFITTVISSSTGEIQLDKDGDVDSEDWLNFVGYDDPADYAKIVLNDEAKLSFTIRATDAAKFVIYGLTEKTGRNGVVSYSKKALQTTTLKKDKQTQLYTVNTKALKLAAGEYYVSVQSTNAKKGGNAYYSVNLNEERCWFAEDAKMLALSDSKSADALTQPDDLSFGQYCEDMTLAAPSVFTTERIFEESGKGILASL